MKFTRAEITARSDAKKRADGMILKRHWIPNKPEAISELKRQAALIKKQYGDL